MRPNNRRADELRPLSFTRNYLGMAPGRVLVQFGNSAVLCACSIEATVPPFLVGTGKGWLTAEYGMLPGSTSGRKPRDKGGKVDGRSVEIQRLIGRSLRAIVDLTKLGERTLWIDCDVLQADGGTRTAAISGAFVALVDALTSLRSQPNLIPPLCPLSQILQDSVAAISVGIVAGVEVLDLEYVEDRDALVDMNLVTTGSGRFIEVQGTGENATFDRRQLDRLLELGMNGISAITKAQRDALGPQWPLD
jgi:ribonuclease PH